MGGEYLALERCLQRLDHPQLLSQVLHLVPAVNSGVRERERDNRLRALRTTCPQSLG